MVDYPDGALLRIACNGARLCYNPAMRLWPFGSSEKRAVGTGDSGVNSYLTDVANYLDAGGTPADVNGTAAVEFALGMIARAFMAAVPVPAVPGLNALTLAMIARQTISLGNAVFQVNSTGPYPDSVPQHTRQRVPGVVALLGEAAVPQW